MGSLVVKSLLMQPDWLFLSAEDIEMSYLMHHFPMMKEYWQQLHGTKMFNYGMSHREHTGVVAIILTQSLAVPAQTKRWSVDHHALGRIYTIHFLYTISERQGRSHSRKVMKARSVLAVLVQMVSNWMAYFSIGANVLKLY